MTVAEFLTQLQSASDWSGLIGDNRRNYTIKFFCLSTENMNMKMKQINMNDHTRIVEIELMPEHP